jgi:uncharacterized protein YneF (UPF0154 family)
MSHAAAAGVTGALFLLFMALGAYLSYRTMKRAVDDALKDRSHG